MMGVDASLNRWRGQRQAGMEYTVLLIVAGDGRVGAMLLGPAEWDTSTDKTDDVSHETQSAR